MTLARRRRWTRVSLVLLAVLASLTVAAPGVSALDQIDLDDCSDSNTFCANLTVERPGTTDPEPEGPTGGNLHACSAIYEVDGVFTFDVCDSEGNFVATIATTATPARPRPRPTQSNIIASAMGALNPPRPTVLTSPNYWSGLLVQTPTWLWVPLSYWRTYTTTVVVWGYVVTIYATPTVVRWNMGNGDSITCIGPGTPWIPGFGDALSTCKYIYRHSSEGKSRDRYKITATVTFVGSFTTVGLGGMSGPLGAVTRSSSVHAEVAEIQGLVTR